MIVDSHAVGRNNTERACVPFTQLSPVSASCKTVVQYHNPDVDIDIFYCLTQISPVLSVCVCLCTQSSVELIPVSPAVVMITEEFSPKGSLSLPFYNHSYFPFSSPRIPVS